MHPAILTVLRSGGEYRPEHVLRLRDQCARHAPDTPFVCLSDIDVPGVRVRQLAHGWPGWWSKIEAFGVPGPVLYMDLDTTVRGDLSPLLAAACLHPFIALRDFNPDQREMGSGLMAWSGDMRRILAAFLADPDGHMARCRTSRHWGDQGFVEPLTPGRAYWQEVIPGMVASWKMQCRDGVPSDARIVCFHGQPRPWHVAGEALECA